MYTMPYEVLNVANMARGRQAWQCLYACTHGSTPLAMARLTSQTFLAWEIYFR